MSKIKFYLIIITTFLTIILLGSCADVDGEISSVSSNVVSVQTSGLSDIISDITLEKEEGKVLTDFGEVSSFPEKCKIFKQKCKYFSENELLNFFHDVPQKSSDSTQFSIKYVGEEQSGYIDNDVCLSFCTRSGSLFETVLQALVLREKKEQAEKTVLGFATRDEVINHLQILLKDFLGIMPEDWWANEFYGVKAEDVELYKAEILRQASDDADSADELVQEKIRQQAERIKNISSNDFYYIDLKFKIDGIPMYMGNRFNYGTNDGYMISGTSARIVYTQNGIESIYLFCVYELDSPEIRDVSILIPEEARELITDKYEGIFFSGEVDVYDMKLMYLPIPQFDMNNRFINFETRPFYAFYYKQNEYENDEVYTVNYISYFDAVTGAEFGTEQIW